eukprot:CAMPEP_0170529894 /NCGR_PEP_ID=MMETSP0209-20121228/35748_1 /TAXON_ID=665100 ORGANISM="Litonotus pictus, Strain P1" /NCGR_SAMPLE_ID=MMETSP0209 /ASSEMBLY_ACC=CAM_ASM_000301 /LENGTH=42 /DNA_ID= /DNA_START= /DNA_END= /DNA_ORIENTATION=
MKQIDQSFKFIVLILVWESEEGLELNLFLEVIGVDSQVDEVL